MARRTPLRHQGLLQEYREPDLTDLIEQTVNLGTAGLNGVLSSIPYVDVQLVPTKIFTNEAGEVLELSTSSLNDLVDNLSRIR